MRLVGLPADEVGVLVGLEVAHPHDDRVRRERGAQHRDALGDPLHEELPRTGVGAEREKMLSAARIVSSAYGTRCSTVLKFAKSGAIRFAERTYGPEGTELDTASYEFRRDS